MGVVGYLLDTHTFLWATQDAVQLSEPVKKAMNDKDVQKFVSAASAYEIMNKYRLGKLPEYAFVAENYFQILRSLGVHAMVSATRQFKYYLSRKT